MFKIVTVVVKSTQVRLSVQCITQVQLTMKIRNRQWSAVAVRGPV